MTYSETLQYLYNSQPAFHLVGAAAYKPGLGNTVSLMQALGNPHLQFPTVHIAGTNGKGSTSHMLAAILQSSGYKTALYTSPHLVDYRERIRINGIMIPEQAVVDFVEHNRQLLEKVKPSFFETTMALAFSWFASEKVDIAVVEVGLGGRLDSTNIITPQVSVITNIGLDHTEFLGDTLEEIATEKAGIIKPHVPVVIGEACAQTRPVFLSAAERNSCDILFAEEQSFTHLPDCQLKGLYQQKNIRTVLSAVSVLRTRGWDIPKEAVSQGLMHVCDLTGLQGRWQQLTILSPKTHSLNIILDTGHNSHGVRAYIDDLKLINNLRIVFGMVSDKDVTEVLRLLPKSATYYFTQAQTHRAIPAPELLNMASAVGLQGRAFSYVESAVTEVINEAAADDTIFIGGSNYVVGEALRLFQN